MPIAVAIAISFAKYTVMSAPSWVGLRNYIRIFTTPAFYNALKVTGQYVVMRVAALLVFAFVMALITSNRYAVRGLHQSMFFLPYVAPLAVTSIIWKLLYQPFGLVESLLALLGIGAVSWLTSAHLALPAITVSTVWKGSGYYSILVLAGLQTISSDQLEAAIIDGANSIQRFIFITIPNLKPMLYYIVVVAVINTIRGFSPFLIMTGGGPGEATRVIGLLVYEYGFTSLRMGLAATVSVVFLVLILIFSLSIRFFFEPPEERQ
jgi:ABC-type sugar transport system permease subunit